MSPLGIEDFLGIENLLGNVSKYALENSRVYVNISRKNSGVLLEVKNISKDALNISEAELMERFTRGDASRNTEGSGLGLAIAKDLVRLMDGIFEITIDGDLFKASVLLEEAAKQNRTREKQIKNKGKTYCRIYCFGI